jgi:hypothetical protein
LPSASTLVASQAGKATHPQKIEFHSVAGESLARILNLSKPKFVDAAEAHKQLSYIDDYVRGPAFGCKTVVVEEHYIDRDHMEDHSVFYSKSLYPYPNFCRRIHFFSLEQNDLRKEIRRVRESRANEDTDAFRRECAEFSRLHYIGFAVIKPLPGCPVGRTVLRCLPKESGKGYLRKFHCACDYDPHLLGLRLTVTGLAFQQQDLGVSACATTALWTSLQRARQLEQSANATPAQITIRASQFNLRFGRPMPSEGLSLDQMCQAVQSLGYSPNLHRAESYEVTRALVFSAVSSGISPVLIMELPGQDISHAVAAVGIGVAKATEPPTTSGIRHRSTDMVAIYVHDDREGPYLKATIRRRKETFLIHLRLPNGREEPWRLTHLLIPLHPKIRLSFAQLYTAGLDLVYKAQSFAMAQAAGSPAGTGRVTTVWKSRILRSNVYMEYLLREAGRSATVEKLCKTVRLSRYVGSVRVEAPGLDPFDVLLDTTSTERNLNCLAVVQLGNSCSETAELCRFIVDHYGGRWIA